MLYGKEGGVGRGADLKAAPLKSHFGAALYLGGNCWGPPTYNYQHFNSVSQVFRFLVSSISVFFCSTFLFLSNIYFFFPSSIFFLLPSGCRHNRKWRARVSVVQCSWQEVGRPHCCRWRLRCHSGGRGQRGLCQEEVTGQQHQGHGSEGCCQGQCRQHQEEQGHVAGPKKSPSSATATTAFTTAAAAIKGAEAKHCQDGQTVQQQQPPPSTTSSTTKAGPESAADVKEALEANLPTVIIIQPKKEKKKYDRPEQYCRLTQQATRQGQSTKMMKG